MHHISTYDSKLGKILLAADDKGLSGVWFEGAKYYAAGLRDYDCNETEILKDTKKWLDIYFSGKEPEFTPELHMEGTPFQLEVWDILKKIPYGKTTTYGRIACEIALKRGIKKMSSRAVGGAVGHNKISIIVPCHRVLGVNNSLGGYAGGRGRKLALLGVEGNKFDTSK